MLVREYFYPLESSRQKYFILENIYIDFHLKDMMTPIGLCFNIYIYI